MRDLPAAQVRNCQECKEGISDTSDTEVPDLTISDGMFSTMKVNKSRMYAATQTDVSNAPDLSD